MSQFNQGSQYLTYDFRHPAKGKDFNRVGRDVVKPGVYKGLTISFSGNDVFISAGKCFINCLYNGIDNLGIKIDFQSLYSYGTILPSEFGANEILYIEYEYGQVDDNYADFKRQSINTWLAAPNANAIILGEITFDGSNNITGVDYSRKTWGIINADADWGIPDRLIYHDTDNINKKWRLDGSLLPTGIRDLKFQTFDESEAEILTTTDTNTTVVKNRLQVAKFDGRVPLGTVVPIAPVFTATANGGTASEPPGIPASGVVTDDGWQRADGAIIPSGANASLVSKFTCDLSDDRFIMGASGITSNPIAVSDGVNLANNTVLLAENQIPEHSFSGSTSTNGDHNHVISGFDNDASPLIPGVDELANIENYPSGLYTRTTSTAGDHSHSFTTDTYGGGLAFDIRPKWLKGIYLQRVR